LPRLATGRMEVSRQNIGELGLCTRGHCCCCVVYWPRGETEGLLIAALIRLNQRLLDHSRLATIVYTFCAILALSLCRFVWLLSISSSLLAGVIAGPCLLFVRERPQTIELQQDPFLLLLLLPVPFWLDLLLSPTTKEDMVSRSYFIFLFAISSMNR